jgi:hypothetical protein
MLQSSSGSAGRPKRLPARLKGVMRTSLALGRGHPRARTIVADAAAALLEAWAAHTVKRAIADVTSTSGQDYRAFGFDKAEMLDALERLLGEIEVDRAVPATRVDQASKGLGLAIVVTRRRP